MQITIIDRFGSDRQPRAANALAAFAPVALSGTPTSLDGEWPLHSSALMSMCDLVQPRDFAALSGQAKGVRWLEGRRKQSRCGDTMEPRDETAQGPRVTATSGN